MVLASILNKRSLQQDVFTRNVSSLAALVVLIFEYIVALGDEQKYIWRGQLNKVKGLYFFSRYFGLCAQIANTVMVFIPLSEIPVPRQRCKGWFVYLAICACLLMAAIHTVLMLRVYVLYNRSWRIALFLFCMLLLQCGLVTSCTSKTINVVPFDGICDVQTTPVEVLYFMSSAIISQVTLLFMTIAKRKVAFGQSPVIELVVRDGAWVFALIFGMMATTIPYSLLVQISKPHIVLVWPITILSFSCCRLVLNMQKIGFRLDDDPTLTERSTQSTGIAFTSFIDTSDMPDTPNTDVDSIELSSTTHTDSYT